MWVREEKRERERERERQACRKQTSKHRQTAIERVAIIQIGLCSLYRSLEAPACVSRNCSVCTVVLVQ